MTDWTRVLRACAPHADARIVAAIADHAAVVLPRWKITTPNRLAHLLAHISVESAGFTRLEENLNYSAERLRAVWPNRFRAPGAAEACAHNPKALAMRVYGGRLGNRPNSDDGWTFRGQGLLQTTGRDNIEKLADELGTTPEEAAAWLTDDAHMLECAAANFVINGALHYADEDNIEGSTRAVNGGLNGLADRKAALTRFKRALGASGPASGALGLMSAADDAGPADEPPALPAEQVKAIQRQLRAKGYFPGAIDGEFGVSTTGAIAEMQKAEGVAVTGELDEAASKALWSKSKRPVNPERAAATEDDLRDMGSATIADADDADAGHAKVIGSATTAAAGGGWLAKDTPFGWFSDHKDSLVESFDKFRDAQTQVNDTAPGLLPWLTDHAASLGIVLLIILLGTFAFVELRRARAATRRIRIARVQKHNSGADRSR